MKMINDSMVLSVAMLLMLPGILLLAAPHSAIIVPLLAIDVLASVLVCDCLREAKFDKNSGDCECVTQQETVVMPLYI